MTKFIELTDFDTNNLIILNIDNIIRIYKNGDGVTQIQYGNETKLCDCCVKEFVKEIAEILCKRSDIRDEA